MNTSSVLALAFAIGMIAGLRSMTAPAVVSWAAYWKWLDLQHSAAIGELVVDKLPGTPSRKAPLGLIARFVLGGLSGAALCAATNQSLALGGVLGGLGGVIGALVGYEVRTRLVKALKVPDIWIALLEDAVAIGVGFFIVSRFR
jgi:uncharacterized membrane protein